MAIDDVVRTDRFITEMPWFMFRPPSWTRLEPTSITGDPRPGLEMRVHDPLWMLARQWQFGELTGEDAGTPVVVQISTTSAPLTTFVDASGSVTAIEPGALLDPMVEAETLSAAGPGGWVRAEAGQAFAALVDDVAGGGFAGELRARCAHDGTGLPAAIAGMVLDGERVASELDAAAAAGAALPAWLVPADAPTRDALAVAVATWLAWYRTEVSPAAGAPGSWVPDRLEYRFRVAAGSAAGRVVLDASEFAGGSADWWAFDLAAGADVEEIEAAPQPTEATAAVLASRLRFPGMPADRLWEFEDGAVNLGALEAQPHDLARLLFAEFALVTGSDWLVVPVDVPHGTLTTTNWVTYTTTFGERFLVPHTSEATSDDDRWTMFTITGDDADRLLVAPAAAAVVEGDAVEDVAFLRDEMANLVWAVEQRYRDPDGVVHVRGRGAPPLEEAAAGGIADAELDYRLASTVPTNWIPYVAMSTGYRVIKLRRAVVPGQPDLAPLGELIPETDGLVDGEVPREGVRVRRVPMLTRYADGRWATWTARRVSIGRGEGSSGLHFDRAVRRPRTS